MSRQATNSRTLKIASHIARMIMGSIFLVSGFVKAVDPWGTMIKVNEYLTIYGWESLIPWSMGFSIWLCGAEFMMGCMLTFKVRIRFVSIFALLSMTIFTIVALLSATVLPVEDCGCFGDALKLTPWQTFYKNLSILPLAAILYWRYRPDKIFLFNKVELVLAICFFSLAMGIPTYCYRHMPLIDYLPYRVGVNLPAAIAQAKATGLQSEGGEVVLIYRNLRSGKLRQFALDDKAWHDETRWEWVETLTLDEEPDVRPLVGEFTLHGVDGEERTDEVLATKGGLHILFAASLGFEGYEECSDTFERFIREKTAQGDRVVCVTPNYIDESGLFMGIECLNIDPTTMKTALRANYGVISLRDGVIVDKRNCRDM